MLINLSFQVYMILVTSYSQNIKQIQNLRDRQLYYYLLFFFSLHYKNESLNFLLIKKLFT